jgi:beta-N-acetylhexosaminidase
MGLPDGPTRGAFHLATHGATRVTAQAAADLLAG